jgi:transposase-like protein
MQLQEGRRTTMLSLARQWRQSGTTTQAFAREHGITRSNLYYWRKRLNREERPARPPRNTMMFLARRWRESGATTQAFAQQHGITRSNLYYWRKRLDWEERPARLEERSARKERPIRRCAMNSRQLELWMTRLLNNLESREVSDKNVIDEYFGMSNHDNVTSFREVAMLGQIDLSNEDPAVLVRNADGFQIIT